MPDMLSEDPGWQDRGVACIYYCNCTCNTLVAAVPNNYMRRPWIRIIINFDVYLVAVPTEDSGQGAASGCCSMPLNGLLKRIAKLGSPTAPSEPEPKPDLEPELAAAGGDSQQQRVIVQEPTELVEEPQQGQVQEQEASAASTAHPPQTRATRQLLSVDTASLGRSRTSSLKNSSNNSSNNSTKGLSPSANPGLVFTPATPLTGSPQMAKDLSKLRLFGQMRRTTSPIREDSLLHGDQEQEIPPSPQLSASPDSYEGTDLDGDLPGIPRSGSPLPMSGGEESEDDDEEHDLRDAAEAELEKEEQAKDKAAESSKPNKPDPMTGFPGRKLLQRLPSQAITDTPSTDSGGARSPAMSFGFPSLSRNPSTKANTPSGVAQNPSRLSSMDRVPSLSRAADPRSPGKNSPAARVSADYGFPTAAMVADPEAIQEEDSGTGNTASGSGSGSTYASHMTGSPPSSTSYLDASPHRFASPRRMPSSRQTSTSSQHSSTHSVSEYSTPAGFLKHRRNSSQHTREVKETLDATSRSLPGGKRKLNQYILTNDIGRGSFGIVQKAKDVDTGAEYAVKEFSKMRLRKRQQSEMIRRQGRGAAMRRPAVPIRKAPQPRTGQGGEDTGDVEDKREDVPNDLELIRECRVTSAPKPRLRVVTRCRFRNSRHEEA